MKILLYILQDSVPNQYFYTKDTCSLQKFLFKLILLYRLTLDKCYNYFGLNIKVFEKHWNTESELQYKFCFSAA